ncbi:MAG: MFS transporter, partial [Armatimonadetes bacterium]|nr:MFS transporter [Anaerolineae bacterium]
MLRTQLTHWLHPQPHFVVRRSPVYYGWIVWGIATLGIIATSPAQNFTVAQFVDYLIADFQLDRTTISTIFSVGSVVGALCLTWVGRKIDRHGNRLVSAAVIAGFALTLVIISWATTPLMLLTVFIGVRTMGMGSLWIVSSTAIAQWFIRLRGVMFSLTLVIFALWQAVYVPWLQQQLEQQNWRELWLLFGIVIGVVALPFTWILMRNRPEDFGLLADGVQPSATATDLPQVGEVNYTLAEAKRLPVFWVYIAARFVSPLIGSGLIFHQVSIFTSLGHSALASAQNYALMSVMNAILSLGFGMVIMRLRPGIFLAISMLALVAASVCAMTMTTPLLTTVYAASIAVLFSGAGVFDGTIWTNLFGRLHQGAIRGFVAMASIIGAAIGPIAFAVSF